MATAGAMIAKSGLKLPVASNPIKLSQQALKLKPSMFRPAPLPRQQLMKAAQNKVQ